MNIEMDNVGWYGRKLMIVDEMYNNWWRWVKAKWTKKQKYETKWNSLTSENSYKQVKRSDGLRHFACGDVKPVYVDDKYQVLPQYTVVIDGGLVTLITTKFMFISKWPKDMSLKQTPA